MSICHDGWIFITKVLNMYLSMLHNGVFFNMSLGPKNQGKEDKSGMKHVWFIILIYPQRNWIPYWKQGVYFFILKNVYCNSFFFAFLFEVHANIFIYLCGFVNKIFILQEALQYK